MRSCERCKLPLVDDSTGFSHDGRRICTRVECQNVEAMNQMIDDGRMELVPAEQFVTEIKFPVDQADVKGVALEPYMEAVLLKPLPEVDWPFCPHEFVICRQSKRDGQPYCECCGGWLGPLPVDHTRCGPCGGGSACVS